MSFTVSHCGYDWIKKVPDQTMGNDPRLYLGKPDFKDSSKVRSYYRGGYQIDGYIVVWDLKHKNYPNLLLTMST